MASLEDKTGRQLINKVPEVTLYFWIIKIMATTVGETAADYLNVNLGFGLSVTSWVMAGLLAVALLFQISKKSYEPWIYWLTVVLISVVGTLITDNLVDNLGVSLETTTIAFSIALALTFLAWFASEKTLSIHTIFTKRRELFYWLTILFTFALGTAGGDLASEGLAWGYMQSALIFGMLSYAFMLPMMIYRLMFTEQVPDAAKPTLAILAAPASLSLAGYLTITQQPSPVIVALLFGIGVLMTSIIYLSFFKLMRLPFSPGYAAFTFPMVIGATALFKMADWMESVGIATQYIQQINALAEFELLVATAVVAYVCLRYLHYYQPNKVPVMNL